MQFSSLDKEGSSSVVRRLHGRIQLEMRNRQPSQILSCVLNRISPEFIEPRIPIMAAPKLGRPGSDEYAPYYDTYIRKVPNQDLLQLLKEQIESTCGLLGKVSESGADAAYAAGKWTIKEVAGHMADTERIMAYRLLRIARGDTTPLPGFEQDDYVRDGGFHTRTLASLIEEFRIARASTLALLQGLDEAALARVGVANGTTVSARALAYIIAGHERHHVGILREQYRLSG